MMDAFRFNLLFRNRKKSRKACTILYKYYLPKIVMFITYRFNDNDLAQDVAQEFFKNILENEFKGFKLHPNAWVFSCCENLAKKMLLNRKNIPIDECKLTSKEGDPYIEFLFGEFLEMLKKLDSVTREIVVRYDWMGFSFKEIAEQLQLPYTMVRQRHSRAIRKLKKFLN